MFIVIFHVVLVKVDCRENDQENNKYQEVQGKDPKGPSSIEITKKPGIPPCIQKYGRDQKTG